MNTSSVKEPCKNALFTSSWRIGQLLVTARVSNLPRCHWLININKKTTYVESDSIQRYFQPLECAIAIAVITPTHSAWYANPLPNESAKHPCTKPPQFRKIPPHDDGPGWPLEHPSVLTWIHPGGGGCHRIEWITGALRGFPLSPNARSLSRSVCESVLRADDSWAFQVLTCGWEARMLFANWWPCPSSSESSSSVFSRADKTWVNFSYKAFCSESRLCFRASNSNFLRFGILLPDPREMIGIPFMDWG